MKIPLATEKSTGALLPRMRNMQPLSPSSMGYWTASALVAVLIGYQIARLPHLEGESQVLGSLALLILVAILPTLRLRMSPVLLSPGALYSLITLATFALGSLAWLGSPEQAVPGLTQKWIAGALVLISFGVVCFWIGYKIASPRGEVLIIAPRRTISLPVLVGLFITGAAAQLFLLSLGAYGYLLEGREATAAGSWTQWVAVVGDLTVIAVYVGAMYAFSGRSGTHWWIFAGLLFANSALGLASGYKGRVVWPIIWSLFIYYYYRRRIPLRWASLTLLALFFLVPANLSFRSALSYDSGSAVGSVLATVRSTVEASVDSSLEDRIGTLTRWSSLRVRDVDSVGVILQKTPWVYPYLGMVEYGPALASTLVPRVFWEEKPVLAAGEEFARTYAGLPETTTTSVPVTHVGDLYRHQGLVGVGLGMLGIGIVAGVLGRWLLRQRGAAAVLVYVVTLSYFVTVESDLVGWFAAAIRSVLLAVIVGRLLFGTQGDISTLEQNSRSHPRLARG
jgi:hypothetical protein